MKKFLFLVTAAILNGGRGCRTPKFNIVEFFVVNFICVKLFAVGNYYDHRLFTSDVVMEARASLGLSFIGM